MAWRCSSNRTNTVGDWQPAVSSETSRVSLVTFFPITPPEPTVGVRHASVEVNNHAAIRFRRSPHQWHRDTLIVPEIHRFRPTNVAATVASEDVMLLRTLMPNASLGSVAAERSAGKWDGGGSTSTPMGMEGTDSPSSSKGQTARLQRSPDGRATRRHGTPGAGAAGRRVYVVAEIGSCHDRRRPA